MNKQEYLSALEYALEQMPPEEREKQLAYYDELICDMCEDGMSEEEATLRRICLRRCRSQRLSKPASAQAGAYPRW